MIAKRAKAFVASKMPSSLVEQLTAAGFNNNTPVAPDAFVFVLSGPNDHKKVLVAKG